MEESGTVWAKLEAEVTLGDIREFRTREYSGSDCEISLEMTDDNRNSEDELSHCLWHHHYPVACSQFCYAGLPLISWPSCKTSTIDRSPQNFKLSSARLPTTPPCSHRRHFLGETG